MEKPIIVFNLDFNRPGYRNPKNRIEKLFLLAALLRQGNRRNIETLAEILEKCPRRLKDDLELINQHFDVCIDNYNRPYIKK